jgi:arginyl-tRNA synthetase
MTVGNQIDNLGISIKERYKELCGMKFKIPEDGYFGAEIKNIAEKIYINNNNKYIDKPLDYFKDIGVSELINKIRIDLENFRIKFDVWTSEKEIRKGGKIEETLNKLKILNKTYEKENALWLKSSIYGDEKDRVLIKKDGEYTYLTPDIAYHLDKFDRGFQNLINVFGADHHGYVPRLKAGVEALGYNKEQLEVKIVQMVRLLKGREEIKMSKRTGNVVTLEDLLEEVGVDSVRYFFAMRNIDTQMDFDIDLALKKSNENPFYYVGYAHARICSILKEIKKDIYCNKFTTIKDEYAYNMIAKLHEFSDVIKISALKNAPHLITNYLYDLANLFHIYYTNEKIIVEDEKMLKERIMLITAVKIVIKNGLNLIGVEGTPKNVIL